MKCPNCSAQLSAVYYSTVCPQCGRSLHTCVMCDFYSPQSHYGCREHIDELVQDKERPNFCDFFRLSAKPVDFDKNRSGAKKAEDLFDSFFTV